MNNKLKKNAVMAVIQVLVTGVILFLLYRYLFKVIGATQVGIWSVVMTSISAARLSEIGFTATSVRYVAKYIAENKKNKASEVVETTVITIGIALIVFLICLYPIIVWTIGKLIPNEMIEEILVIIPYALISLWISSIAGVFLSGLDGCQRIDQRVIITISSGVVFFAAVVMLTADYGLLGLAWAQILQGLVMLIGGSILLKKELPLLPIIKLKWKYKTFREMFKYALNFQVITICTMLFDPVTKILLAKFGDLPSVAYYEIANQMITKFRSLIVAINQALVPRAAEINEKNPQHIKELYLKVNQLILYLSTIMYSIIFASLPLISQFWLGNYEEKFVEYSIILLIIWWINTLTTPLYYIYMGKGVMRWNTISHIVTGLGNVTLGFILGTIVGDFGVIAGFGIAQIVGSMFMILGNCKDSKIPLINIIPEKTGKLLIGIGFGLLVGWVIFYLTKNIYEDLFRGIILLIVYATSAFPLILNNPALKILIRIIK